MSTKPLSPHLQVYRPQLTSVMSISHRVTGVALAAGTVMLLYWLVATALGGETYAEARRCFGAGLTQLLMFGWTVAFYYHLCNGLRHLWWDLGRGFELADAYRNGYLVLGATAVLTLLTWGCVLAQGGAA